MRYLFLTCLLFVGSLLYGQSLRVSAAFDSTDILIGDQVWLRMELDCDAKTNIQWPQWGDSLTSTIEILKVDSLKSSVLPDGRVHSFQRILVTSFDSGTHVVPPIAWSVESGSVRDTILSTPLSLNVHTVPVDMKKGLKDIKPVFQLPVTFKEALPWLIGAMFGVALLFLLWRYLRYRKKRSGGGIPKPELPPFVIALNGLEELKSANLWQHGQYKEFHTRLTDILRVYLEGQFGINALEMTSDELLESLKKSKVVSKGWLTRLRLLFSCADLSKFAKYQPLPQENETCWQNAYAFVQETKPAPAEVIGDSDAASPKVENNDDPLHESKVGRASL